MKHVKCVNVLLQDMLVQHGVTGATTSQSCHCIASAMFSSIAGESWQTLQALLEYIEMLDGGGKNICRSRSNKGMSNGVHKNYVRKSTWVSVLERKDQKGDNVLLACVRKRSLHANNINIKKCLSLLLLHDVVTTKQILLTMENSITHATALTTCLLYNGRQGYDAANQLLHVCGTDLLNASNSLFQLPILYLIQKLNCNGNGNQRNIIEGISFLIACGSTLTNLILRKLEAAIFGDKLTSVSLSSLVPIPSLTMLASKVLMRTLSCSTVMDVLQQAVLLDATELRVECQRYIIRNYEEIIKIWSDEDEEAPDGRELLVYVLLLGEHDQEEEE